MVPFRQLSSYWRNNYQVGKWRIWKHWSTILLHNFWKLQQPNLTQCSKLFILYFPRFHGSQVLQLAEFPSFQVFKALSKYPNFRGPEVSKYPIFQFPSYPSIEVANFPSSRFPSFPTIKVSKFPIFQIPLPILVFLLILRPVVFVDYLLNVCTHSTRHLSTVQAPSQHVMCRARRRIDIKLFRVCLSRI